MDQIYDFNLLFEMTVFSLSKSVSELTVAYNLRICFQNQAIYFLPVLDS